jgi:hypothetical protein
VLVEDPVLFIQAMEQGDIYIYYNQYPLQNWLSKDKKPVLVIRWVEIGWRHCV